MLAPLLHHPVTGPVAGAILGAILGSFIAALASRWPQGKSVLTGRSHCDSCGQTLSAWQLVPVLSYIAVRGKCTTCGAPIARDSLSIELAGTVIGGLALALQPGWPGLAVATFGWLLLPLAWLDWRHFWLPRPLTAALAAGGVMAGLAGFAPDWTSRLIGCGAGFATLGLIALAYRTLRGREGLGGGDPLLFGAIGLWLGWERLPLVLMLASGAGLAIALIWHWRGRRLTNAMRFPLGTLLAGAAWPVALLTAQAPTFP